MPRATRTIEPGVAYHVTQRGVDRRKVFFRDSDRRTYLNLISENLADARVSVLAYSLITNHVHWVVVPEREDSLAVLFRRAQGRYAQYVNASRSRTGHLWQNRYFSCPVARAHLWSAIRYVELNAVRAGIVKDPATYRWSSAPSHLAGPEHAAAPFPLDWTMWREAGASTGWKELLTDREHLAEVVELRRCTYSGKPFGPTEFIERMETAFDRHWRNPGRPPKSGKSEKGTIRSASVSAP
jgi:putative transposase